MRAGEGESREGAWASTLPSQSAPPGRAAAEAVGEPAASPAAARAPSRAVRVKVRLLIGVRVLKDTAWYPRWVWWGAGVTGGVSGMSIVGRSARLAQGWDDTAARGALPC